MAKLKECLFIDYHIKLKENGNIEFDKDLMAESLGLYDDKTFKVRINDNGSFYLEFVEDWDMLPDVNQIKAFMDIEAAPASFNPVGYNETITVNTQTYDPNDPKWIKFDKQMAFIADNWGNIPSGEKKDENQKSQQSESRSKVLAQQDGSGKT